MSFLLIVVCSSFINIAVGKTFSLYSGGAVTGADANDFNFLIDRCAEDGLEPASFENAQEEADAAQVCSGNCFIGLVRDIAGADETKWYWVQDGSYSLDGTPYLNFGSGEPQDTEKCVVLSAPASHWADVPCNWTPTIPLICQTISTNPKCDRLDLDGYLDECSDRFAEITTNSNDNKAKITDIQSEISDINTALEELSDISAAYGIHGNIDNGDNNNKIFMGLDNNTVLLISLLTNILLIMCGCYMVSIFSSNKPKYEKVINFADSDTSPFKLNA